MKEFDWQTNEFTTTGAQRLTTIYFIHLSFWLEIVAKESDKKNERERNATENPIPTKTD